jgi:hypothetical protein
MTLVCRAAPPPRGLNEVSKGADRSVPCRRRTKVGTSLKHSIYAIGIPLAEAQLPVVQAAN